jgi:hypothetical protein
MSRGSGRIERAIIEAFKDDPDNAFTVAELYDRIYPDAEWFDKKHRVAIIRAATSLKRRWPDLGWTYSGNLGGQKVFFDAANIMSWAMARLKADQFLNYDNQDRRTRRWTNGASEDGLYASLLEGGKHHHCIVEGGAWRLHRDMWIAERDGDTARVQELQAEQDRINAEIGLRISTASEKIKPSVQSKEDAR